MYATIILEFILISISILLLFRFRSELGLAPLYILLGSIQYLQANLGAEVSFVFFDSYAIYPGSVILFSAVLFAVLLIYIKEGVASARTLIMGIIISNFIMVGLFEITHAQLLINEKSQGLDLNPVSIFKTNQRFFILGTFILVLDFFLLTVLYQFLISKIRKTYFFFTLFLSLFLVLMFDSLLFNALLFYDATGLKSALISHLVGKTVAAIIFSLILYIYLKFVIKETRYATFITSQKRDIFSILYYQKKIKNLETEKKEIEEKLVSQIETTLNKISDGFVSLDTQWCYTYVNEKAGELLGRIPSDLIGKNIWVEFPHTVKLSFDDVYKRAVKTQETHYFEEYHELFDKWFEVRVYPATEGLSIYFSDITDRKKADEKNQILLSLIETSDDFIGLATLDGKPFYVNTPGRALVGLEAQEALPNSISAFFPETSPAFLIAENEPGIIRNTSWNGETEFQHFKTGAKIPMEMSRFLIRDKITNQPIALGNVAKNITKRKQIEKKIINSEKLFRSLTSNAPVAIFQSNIKGFCNYVNEEWLKYTGMSFNESMGFGWKNAIHPEDRARVSLEWQEASLFEKEFISDFRVQDKTGKVTWLSVKTVGLYDTQNKLYGCLGILLDITERKRAEEEIIKNERYLESIINNIGDPVFVKDDQNRLILVNEAFCSMLNLSKEAIIGKTLAENVSPDEKEIYFHNDNQVLSTGIANINEETLTVQGEAKRIISTKKTRFVDDAGNKFLIGTIRDVTKRKTIETELKKHKYNLEELVKIRTEEINLKNAELQRINKLFVGRELKMKELKNIIKELKQKHDN
ncbi:PAS domain S-box protein [Mariniflexile ostreae]|uniref:histidine kinase n=1 Tax=Mariniflexile ostreae TaxID=1520892 RepID=A0ABV5F801_9FLAO